MTYRASYRVQHITPASLTAAATRFMYSVSSTPSPLASGMSYTSTSGRPNALNDPRHDLSLNERMNG